MTVSDNTILAEGLGNVFYSLGPIVSKRMAKKVLRNPGKLLQRLLKKLLLEILKRLYQHYQR